MALAMEHHDHAGAALTACERCGHRHLDRSDKWGCAWCQCGHAAACPCAGCVAPAQRVAADVELHGGRGLVAVLARLFLDEAMVRARVAVVERRRLAYARLRLLEVLRERRESLKPAAQVEAEERAAYLRTGRRLFGEGWSPE